MEFPPQFMEPGMADRPLPGGAGIQPVTRSAWGADPPKGRGKEQPLPASHMILHWTNTPMCLNSTDCSAAVRQLQKDDMDRGSLDIKYNFVVGGDGEVYEGRGWKIQSPSISSTATDTPQEYHNRTILVGLTGKERSFGHKPQTDALGRLISQGVVSLYLVNNVKLHALVRGKLSTIPTPPDMMSAMPPDMAGAMPPDMTGAMPPDMTGAMPPI